MATSTIKNPMAWKLKGTASGVGSTVNMPTDYNEIMLVATYSTYSFFSTVPKSEISSTAIYPRFATYYNASSNAGGYFTVNSSTASIGSLTQNSGQAVTGATFKLYYR